MKLPKYLLAIASLLLILSGCGGGHSAAPPSDLKATAGTGDGSVTLTWTMEPDVQYALYYAATPAITVDNWTNIAGSVPMFEVTSPLLITGLTNGTTYGFVMTGRKNNGPAGVSSPTVTAVPQAAGSTWIPGTPIAASDFNAATYGLTGKTFIAVGDGGKIASSADGKTWASVANNLTTNNLYGAASIGSGYVLAGASGTLLYSIDGINWALQNSTTTSTINAIASNGLTLYVGVGAGGTIIYSSNGSVWATARSVTANDLLAVTYGNSKWVATGKSGTVLTSVDGITWTVATSNSSADFNAVAHGTNPTTKADIYVVSSANGTLLTSSDAATWTDSSATSLLPAGINGITYLSQFIAAGDNGMIYTSTTGAVWQAQISRVNAKLKAITHSNYSYLAVGAAGANVLSL